MTQNRVYTLVFLWIEAGYIYYGQPDDRMAAAIEARLRTEVVRDSFTGCLRAAGRGPNEDVVSFLAEARLQLYGHSEATADDVGQPNYDVACSVVGHNSPGSRDWVPLTFALRHAKRGMDPRDLARLYHVSEMLGASDSVARAWVWLERRAHAVGGGYPSDAVKARFTAFLSPLRQELHRVAALALVMADGDTAAAMAILLACGWSLSRLEYSLVASQRLATAI